MSADRVQRRRLAVGAAAAMLLSAAAPARAAFDFGTVAKKAEKLATQAWQEPTSKIPDWLLKISYDQWRDIRFRADQAIWRDKQLPFQVQLFHLGLFYNRPVAMNLV